MAVGHLQVKKAFNTRSLGSKQLAAGGQTLTCAIRRSGIGGLDLFITTSAGFDLLELERWWVEQHHVLLGGWWLGGWSSRDRLWLVQPQCRRSPNKAELVISSNKSTEQKTHYDQGAALTVWISLCQTSSISVPVVLQPRYSLPVAGSHQPRALDALVRYPPRQWLRLLQT
jgi:hypothetical protein